MSEFVDRKKDKLMEKSSECNPSIAGAAELAVELLHRGKKKRFSNIMTKF